MPVLLFLDSSTQLASDIEVQFQDLLRTIGLGSKVHILCSDDPLSSSMSTALITIFRETIVTQNTFCELVHWGNISKAVRLIDQLSETSDLLVVVTGTASLAYLTLYYGQIYFKDSLLNPVSIGTKGVVITTDEPRSMDYFLKEST